MPPQFRGSDRGFVPSGHGCPPRMWHEFPTYKKRFERMRPIFAGLAKANLVPMSFYLKYCFPVKVKA